jgi:lipid-A-disaccharide synthase
MVSCGEASGDLYAAALARELTALAPGTEVFGFGGAQLAAAGGQLVGDYAKFAVTGLSEALSVLPRSLRMIRQLAAEAGARRPDVFVAIDFPDFNFRLLPAIHRLGIPIVYYISPQIWAWRPGRMEVLRRYVSRVLVIFPFEAAIYEKASMPVEFVGHPLVELIPPPEPREAWLGRLGLDRSRPVVALLPGSRPNEVDRLLPVISAALPLVEARVPGAQFVVARAPALSDGTFARLAGRANVRIVTGATDAVLAASDAVVTASGTATVQTALHGRPMVIVYRLSGLTYAIGKAFVTLPHYGMVNLIAGRQVVAELIQHDCTPARLAGEVVALLTDEARSTRMRDDLAQVRARLGGPGASRRAAQAVLAVARPTSVASRP